VWEAHEVTDDTYEEPRRWSDSVLLRSQVIEAWHLLATSPRAVPEPHQTEEPHDEQPGDACDVD